MQNERGVRRPGTRRVAQPPLTRVDCQRVASAIPGADNSSAFVMDLGWIATFEAPSHMAPQVSIANEGGSGTRVPDLSVEVDDLDEALRRVREAGFTIEYGPATEDWGVRRFYVRDPFGRVVNILAHV